MSTRNPKLKVEISATDHLSREAREAVSRVARSMRALRNVGIGSAKILGVGLAATGAAAWAAYRALKAYSDEADSLSEASKQIGINISELQSLAYAAKRSGVEMDGLQSMLGTFSTNLGRLATGKGKLAGLLKLVAPSLLKGLKGAGSPAEALDLMLKAIDAADTPAKKAALAVAAFGEEGLAIIKMLADGRDGLEKTRSEFFRFGRALSSVEGNQAEQFNDAIDDVWTSLSGLRAEIGARLIPVLTPMATKLAEAISDQRVQLADRFRYAVEGIATWLYEIDWSSVADGIGQFAKASWTVADALAEVVGNLDIIVDRTGAIESRFQAERAPVAEAALARAEAGAASLLATPQTLDEALEQARTARLGQTGHVGFVPGAPSEELGVGTLALRKMGEWLLPLPNSPLARPSKVDGEIVLRLEGNTDAVQSVRTSAPAGSPRIRASVGPRGLWRGP